MFNHENDWEGRSVKMPLKRLGREVQDLRRTYKPYFSSNAQLYFEKVA